MIYGWKVRQHLNHLNNAAEIKNLLVWNIIETEVSSQVPPTLQSTLLNLKLQIVEMPMHPTYLLNLMLHHPWTPAGPWTPVWKLLVSLTFTYILHLLTQKTDVALKYIGFIVMHL